MVTQDETVVCVPSTQRSVPLWLKQQNARCYPRNRESSGGGATTTIGNVDATVGVCIPDMMEPGYILIPGTTQRGKSRMTLDNLHIGEDCGSCWREHCIANKSQRDLSIFRKLFDRR